MVDPTANWCPTSGTYRVKHVTNGSAVASAVNGTKGTIYTKLTDMASNVYNDFIDGAHGIQGVNPTRMLQFRGYPKPVVTATFSEFFNSSTGTDALRVECTIPNKVGFDIHIDFQNLDVDATIYEVTISAGQTTSGVSPLFFAAFGNTPINYTMTWYSATSTVQYTPTLAGSTTGTLTFVVPILRDFNIPADFYNSDLCLTGTTALDGSYYLGRVWADQVIVCCNTGYTLYKGETIENGGTTNVGANVFRIENLHLGFDKIVTNSSGVITSFVRCSP